MSGIEPLTGTNFSTWRDQVKLTIGVMDLDHALRIDPPAALTAESTADQKRAYEQWERSTEYLSSVEEQFKGTSKAHASTLILKMLTTKYAGVSGVCEHIMTMSNMANKLKGMDIEISEGEMENERTDCYVCARGRTPQSLKSPMSFICLPLNSQYKERAQEVQRLDISCKEAVSLGHRSHGILNIIWRYQLQLCVRGLQTYSKEIRYHSDSAYTTRKERSKGYRFYCPSHSTRIVETRHAEFLENANNSGSGSFRRIELQEAQNETSLIQSKRFLSRNFDMKDLVEASYVIGIEIHRDRANGILGLYQKEYIECILNRFQSNPGLLHWKAAKKVLRYLQGTKEYKLTYTRSDNLEVIRYSDSDFAKCKDTSRSNLGYIFMLLGGPISWKSKKQVLTTTSMMMVEYVSAIEDYCDNSAAMSFLNSNSSTGAGLYLDTKYLFVRERVEEQRISIEHIRTHEMLADPLPKGLPPKVFQGHVAKIENSGITEIDAQIGKHVDNVVDNEILVNTKTLSYANDVNNNEMELNKSCRMSLNEMRYNLRRMWGKHGLVYGWLMESLLLFKNEIRMYVLRKQTPVWVKLLNVLLEAWSLRRAAYARVLVEIDVNKGIHDQIKVVCKDAMKNTKTTKFVKVEYVWRPVMCSTCKVFRHNDKEVKGRKGANKWNDGFQKPNLVNGNGKSHFMYKPKENQNKETKKMTAKLNGSKEKDTQGEKDVNSNNEAPPSLEKLIGLDQTNGQAYWGPNMAGLGMWKDKREKFKGLCVT
ncbi:hypothetical protein Tco_0414304 [Tanacetum coccineum]